MYIEGAQAPFFIVCLPVVTLSIVINCYSSEGTLLPGYVGGVVIYFVRGRKITEGKVFDF